jgi:uncharacterized protein YacL
MVTPPSPAQSQTSAYAPGDAAERQRTLLVRIVRMAFFILIITIAILHAPQATASDSANISWWVPVLIAVALVAVALAVDLATPNKKISAISGVFFGIFAGMLATIALTSIIDLLLQNWVEPKFLKDIGPFLQTVRLLLGITLCYLGITTVIQTQDDFRLVIPYVEFAKQIRGPKPLLLDTSVLIDARIVDLGATGLLQAPLVIPHFVVAELQLLADSADRMKRAKGRRGLDVIGRLQRAPALDVTIDESPVAGKNVDQMLVELGRRMPATIVTTDVALARIAQIQGVTVLNLNDVANALKPALIPGETLTVRPIKVGEQPGQGVGYLDDGTMIVIEQAADRIGQDVFVEVTSSMQTSAGRLIFARPIVDAGAKSGIFSVAGTTQQERRATGRSGVFAAAIAQAQQVRAGEPPPSAATSPPTPAPSPPPAAAGASPGGSGAPITPAGAAAPGAPAAVPAAPAGPATGPVVPPSPQSPPVRMAPPPQIAGYSLEDADAPHEEGGEVEEGAPEDSKTPALASRAANQRSGPFPPKPPSRTPTGRNPRR